MILINVVCSLVNLHPTQAVEHFQEVLLDPVRRPADCAGEFGFLSEKSPRN